MLKKIFSYYQNNAFSPSDTPMNIIFLPTLELSKFIVVTFCVWSPDVQCSRGNNTTLKLANLAQVASNFGWLDLYLSHVYAILFVTSYQHIKLSPLWMSVELTFNRHTQIGYPIWEFPDMFATTEMKSRVEYLQFHFECVTFVCNICEWEKMNTK